MKRLRKEDLNPWLANRSWLVPILCLLLLIISPIFVPLVICWEYRSDVAEIYRYLFRGAAGVEGGIGVSDILEGIKNKTLKVVDRVVDQFSKP